MTIAAGRSKPTSGLARWNGLPPRMRVLYITTPRRTGSWLAEAFASDSASEVILEEAQGAADGVARLREEIFDAVLMSHDAEFFDALEVVEGLRAGGAEEPIIVLGEQPDEELAALCYEVGGDHYVEVDRTTTRMLIWIVARAIQRHELVRENRRLGDAERCRLQQEKVEADRLVREQQTLVGDLQALSTPAARRVERRARDEADDWNHEADLDARHESGAPGPRHADAERGPGGPPGRELPPPAALPPRLVEHYRDLLRAYVIMGTGNLADEMRALAEVLVAAGISSQQAVHLHLHALADLLTGLGGRSARHVLTRADLAVLEVVSHLAEGYRRRYNERLRPPRQRWLPGFDQS